MGSPMPVAYGSKAYERRQTKALDKKRAAALKRHRAKYAPDLLKDIVLQGSIERQASRLSHDFVMIGVFMRHARFSAVCPESIIILAKTHFVLMNEFVRELLLEFPNTFKSTDSRLRAA